MAIIDFKEIHPANSSKTGEQDDFEFFSRDFLDFLGYKVISEPNRGQDGGLDILVEEMRIGISNNTKIRWLVSCKHYAHSNSGKGKSVGIDDEINIIDRVEAYNCHGFIGFYSTIASSGLSDKLSSFIGNKRIGEYQIFDRRKIESCLLNKNKGIIIAKRYFPNSMQKWKSELVKSPEEIRKEYLEDYIRRKRS